MRSALWIAALVLIASPTLLASPTLAQVPPEQETEHLVKAGETLGGIADRAKVPRVLIAEANGIQPPYDVKVGQTLKIPRTRHHIVQAGETGFSLALEYGVSWKDIAVANGLSTDAALKPGQKVLIPTMIAAAQPVAAPAPAASATPKPATVKASAAKPDTAKAAPAAARFAWPLTGTVRRGFTPRGTSNYHDGIDIPAASGTAVRAAAVGTVLFAGTKGDYGNLVIVDHGDGWHTAYGFLSKITVKLGAKVGKAERVGLVGNTGLAKGTELHFEVRRNNKAVDPKGELPAVK